MVQSLRTGRAVTRPTVTPLKSTVLDHATVVEDSGSFGLRRNEGMWPSYNMLDMMIPTALCPDPTEDKEFSVAPWVPASVFAVYGGIQCALIGLDRADQLSEAKRVFEASEGKGVERWLLENRFVARAIDPTRLPHEQVEWDAPVDVTPAGPVPLPVAFALLEGYAASVYHGQSTIHMSRAAASLLGSDKIVWEGDKAFTRTGHKVAMGGGYDDPGVPPQPDWTMYATGEVYVEKSSTVEMQSNTMPGVPAAGLDDNTSLVLVERAFRVGVDGYVAKATGTVWS